MGSLSSRSSWAAALRGTPALSPLLPSLVFRFKGEHDQEHCRTKKGQDLFLMILRVIKKGNSMKSTKPLKSIVFHCSLSLSLWFYFCISFFLFMGLELKSNEMKVIVLKRCSWVESGLLKSCPHWGHGFLGETAGGFTESVELLLFRWGVLSLLSLTRGKTWCGL